MFIGNTVEGIPKLLFRFGIASQILSVTADAYILPACKRRGLIECRGNFKHYKVLCRSILYVIDCKPNLGLRKTVEPVFEILIALFLPAVVKICAEDLMRFIIHTENKVTERPALERRAVRERGNIFADILIREIVGLKLQPLRFRILRPQDINKFY